MGRLLESEDHRRSLRHHLLRRQRAVTRLQLMLYRFDPEFRKLKPSAETRYRKALLKLPVISQFFNSHGFMPYLQASHLEAILPFLPFHKYLDTHKVQSILFNDLTYEFSALVHKCPVRAKTNSEWL